MRHQTLDLQIALLAVLLTVLSAAGCGPGDDESLRILGRSTGGAAYDQITLDLAEESRFHFEARTSNGVIDGPRNAPAQLDEVTSDAPDVAEVVSVDGPSFVVQGNSPGDATLTVQGEEEDATVDVRVRTAQRVQYSYIQGCQGESRTFLEGEEALVRQELFAENGDELQGYDYHPAELRGSVSAAISEDQHATGRMYIDLEEGTGSLTIQPTIDGAGTRVDVVGSDELTRVEVDEAGEARSGSSWSEGDRDFWHPVFYTEDDSAICRGLPDHEIREETPNWCSVEFVQLDRDDLALDLQRFDSWFAAVTLHEPGECTYTVDFKPDALDPLERAEEYRFE